MNENEEQLIRDTIDAYLQAIKTGDPPLFDRAFYSDAVVINASEANPRKAVTPIQDFAAGVLQSHNTGTQLEEKALGLSISYLGRVGNVRLDFELIIDNNTLYGTDFFNIVKRDQTWKISQKIYDVTRTG
jgi:hypothetical protein